MILLISLVLLPFILPKTPAPSIIRNKTRSGNLDCEWMSTQTATQRYPGEVAPVGPRGDFIERSVVKCQERLMRPGLRMERDEAILSALDGRAFELAGVAGAVRPALEERTWLVEAHYPNVDVAGKISFATKNALANQGLRVSDRTPILAVGDVAVLTRMAPEAAYPAACTRYAASGSLGENDVLLSVISFHPKETQLHAGLCVDGEWMWLK